MLADDIECTALTIKTKGVSKIGNMFDYVVDAFCSDKCLMNMLFAFLVIFCGLDSERETSKREASHAP